MTEAFSSRFSICLLIAGALHALVLLGVALPAAAPSQNRTLRVTLTTQPRLPPKHSDTIALAAQRGNDKNSRLATAAMHGTPADSADQAQQLTERSHVQAVTLIARRTDGAARSPNTPTVTTSAAQSNPQSALTRNAQADMRAAYLDAWRRIVERIGNHNLPERLVKKGAGRRLTLEVTLNADGELLNTRVRNSSGNAALDTAAQRMLREAAPFGAFPAALRAHYQTLTFAYDWRFLPDAQARR